MYLPYFFLKKRHSLQSLEMTVTYGQSKLIKSNQLNKLIHCFILYSPKCTCLYPLSFCSSRRTSNFSISMEGEFNFGESQTLEVIAVLIPACFHFFPLLLLSENYRFCSKNAFFQEGCVTLTLNLTQLNR